MAQNIPVFAPAGITQPTNQDWTDYQDAVNAYYQTVSQQILAIQPNAQLEAAPAAFTANPTTATGRLDAAVQTTAWLYRLQAQITPAAAPLPGPAPADISMDQLLQMTIQILQQQVQLQAQALALPPPPFLVSKLHFPPNSWEPLQSPEPSWLAVRTIFISIP